MLIDERLETAALYPNQKLYAFSSPSENYFTQVFKDWDVFHRLSRGSTVELDYMYITSTPTQNYYVVYMYLFITCIYFTYIPPPLHD